MNKNRRRHLWIISSLFASGENLLGIFDSLAFKRTLRAFSWNWFMASRKVHEISAWTEIVVVFFSIHFCCASDDAILSGSQRQFADSFEAEDWRLCGVGDFLDKSVTFTFSQTLCQNIKFDMIKMTVLKPKSRPSKPNSNSMDATMIQKRTLVKASFVYL